jgi:hypothetical protein
VKKKNEWFEIDLLTSCPYVNRSTNLSFLIECKYHDINRYWFFLPLEAAGRWCFDDRVLNCGPYPTLQKPREDTVLGLAPKSSGGIVLSNEGARQDNAVRTAIEQLTNAFVPACLNRMFGYNFDSRSKSLKANPIHHVPNVTALVPMIVTNACLYRLKPEIKDLDIIRKATAPSEIAEELEWTWLYHDAPMRLITQNLDAIRAHLKRDPEDIYRFPNVKENMEDFVDRPNWIAVVNIKALQQVAEMLKDHFLKLGTFEVAKIMSSPLRRRRPKRF